EGRGCGRRMSNLPCLRGKHVRYSGGRIPARNGGVRPPIRSLFPRPEVFDPGRWLPERAKDVTQGSYLPFGGGSRKCIGDVFGMTEATLASRWRLRPVPGETLSPQAGMSLTAGPLTMVPEPR